MSPLKVAGGSRRHHRHGLLGDMKYALTGSRSRRHRRSRMRGGEVKAPQAVSGGAAPAAEAPAAAAPVPEISGGAVVAEAPKIAEVPAVEGGRRRRSSRSRRRHSRHSRRRMGGGLLNDIPFMGGRRYDMFGGAALDGVLGGDIDGGRRRSRRHRHSRRRY